MSETTRPRAGKNLTRTQATPRGATLVWVRQDLRLRDNPALHAAACRGGAVIPVYIWSPDEEGGWAPGSASRWWLHHSLQALDQELRKRGSRLTLARGPALKVLQTLVARTGATAVYWNERYEPAARACTESVARGLSAKGVQTAGFNSALLVEPTTFLNKSGKPYQVYTAFLRGLLHVARPKRPLPVPAKLRAPRRWPVSLPSVDTLKLLPKVKWYESIAASWQPGEAGAHKRLTRFLREALADYHQARDVPSKCGTSRLSAHLHFGEIGPRQIWHALGPAGRNSTYLREIVWREFAYHLLHHFPHTVDQPLRPQFARFPWRTSPTLLQAWQRGQTGIPLVDAGMRELWATGWMHNRVRMVVGSFLVKNLLLRWQEGARWFWDTLVDADLANNTLNWQWVGGCGADAAPYFRIFNPLAQARRFDPSSAYIHKWVPELLARTDYPRPIVDLAKSREAALDAYQAMRRTTL